ncbi:MAG: hypothetical protein PHG29_05565 [Prolixibacteraceae bacterium]|jgi:hypothetical protein|nr:hypothetical protein [Prolixibacteraceae bacterium]NLO01156.1 hypothetical protein [Bacteroidales bacterium]
MNKYIRYDKLDKSVTYRSSGNVKYHVSHEMFVVPWQIEDQKDVKPVDKQD